MLSIQLFFFVVVNQACHDQEVHPKTHNGSHPISCNAVISFVSKTKTKKLDNIYPCKNLMSNKQDAWGMPPMRLELEMHKIWPGAYVCGTRDAKKHPWQPQTNGWWMVYHTQKEGHIVGGCQVGPKLFAWLFFIVIGMAFMERISKMTWIHCERATFVGHLATRQLIHIRNVGRTFKKKKLWEEVMLDFSSSYFLFFSFSFLIHPLPTIFHPYFLPSHCCDRTTFVAYRHKEVKQWVHGKDLCEASTILAFASWHHPSCLIVSPITL